MIFIEGLIERSYSVWHDALSHMEDVHVPRSAWGENAILTCSIASVVKIYSKSPRLMHGLPRGWGAVLIVGVDIVVVHILPSEHGWPWWTAHGCGHKSIGESGPSMLHNLPGFIHDLQRPWKAQSQHCSVQCNTRVPVCSVPLRSCVLLIYYFPSSGWRSL